jgi:putative DNA primase/helicase
MSDYETIPNELRTIPRWILWKAEQRDGKATKIPYGVNGKMIDVTDPASWSSFDTALAKSPRYSGLGFVFSADDDLAGIDLDDCIQNNAIDDWAAEIVATMASYSEVSPSGTGIKIWVHSDITSGVKTRQVEIYAARRFFTVTGWHVEGTPTAINTVNGELHDLIARLKPAVKPIPAPTPAAEPTYTTNQPTRKYLERWAQRKIDLAVERVGLALDGEKHNTRYSMARLLGGLVPLGLTNEDYIARALFNANTPKTQAQRSEWKTIVDGIRDGARAPLTLPDAPQQPMMDSGGVACCPTHKRALSAAKNGNGYTCHARDSSTESGWCHFWWDGDGYHPRQSIDPETGEVLESASADVLIDANRSDVGNAECLAAVVGDDLRYCHTRTKWLIWDGSRWAIDETGASRRMMVDTIRARYHAATNIPDATQRAKFSAWCIGAENSGKIESALKIAGTRESFATQIDYWDNDPLLAAAIGATIDLRTVVHRGVRRDDHLTMRLGATYNPEATCPRWNQFLIEVFKADVEVISFFQRAIGYCLTGDTREQKMFLLYGIGANGKSVVLEILSRLMGDFAGNASFETFDANKRSEASNDLAALRGKRFVTVIETEEGRKLAESRVKSVTGQDAITCRFLYGEYFTYRPTFKIVLAMNHLPVIRGTDNGIWRRILLIPFTESFTGAREDKTLKETLNGELDGILQWALEGLRQWWVRGLDPPQSVIKATEGYRADSDQIGRWMEERCMKSTNLFLPSGKGYSDYKKWCEIGGEETVSQNKWSRRMNEMGLDASANASQRGWFHIGLRVGGEEADIT